MIRLAGVVLAVLSLSAFAQEVPKVVKNLTWTVTKPALEYVVFASRADANGAYDWQEVARSATLPIQVSVTADELWLLRVCNVYDASSMLCYEETGTWVDGRLTPPPRPMDLTVE